MRDVPGEHSEHSQETVAPEDPDQAITNLIQLLRPHLVPLVFEAVGRATMSWEDVEKAGVFKSSDATQCAEAIIDYVRIGVEPEWFTQKEETCQSNQQT